MWEHICSPTVFQNFAKHIIIPDDAKIPLLEFLKELANQKFRFDLYIVVGMGSVRLTTVDYGNCRQPHDEIWLNYKNGLYFLSYYRYINKKIRHRFKGTLEASSILEALSKIELYFLHFQLSKQEWSTNTGTNVV